MTRISFQDKSLKRLYQAVEIVAASIELERLCDQHIVLVKRMNSLCDKLAMLDGKNERDKVVINAVNEALSRAQKLRKKNHAAIISCNCFIQSYQTVQ